MSGEVVALVGVVVGALLGGAAQLAALLLQRSTDADRDLRERRRLAYDEFIGATSQSANTTWALTFEYHWQTLNGVAEPSVSGAEKEREDQAAAAHALSRLRVIAPSDTWEAADSVDDALLELGQNLAEWAKGGTDEDPPSKVALREAEAAFVALAQRDLGIKS